LFFQFLHCLVGWGFEGTEGRHREYPSAAEWEEHRPCKRGGRFSPAVSVADIS